MNMLSEGQGSLHSNAISPQRPPYYQMLQPTRNPPQELLSRLVPGPANLDFHLLFINEVHPGLASPHCRVVCGCVQAPAQSCVPRPAACRAQSVSHIQLHSSSQPEPPHPHSTPTTTQIAKRGKKSPRKALLKERWFWTQSVLAAATQLWPGSPLQLFLLLAVLSTKATPPSMADSGFKAYLLVRYGYLQTHASLPIQPT